MKLVFDSYEEMMEFVKKIGMLPPHESVAPNPEPEKPEPAAEPKTEKQAPEPTPEPAPTYTMVEVRAALAALAKKDKEKMKELLHSFGASNLKEVKQEDYDKLMEACKDA